jgi:hypothetical protein
LLHFHTTLVAVNQGSRCNIFPQAPPFQAFLAGSDRL